MLLRKVSALFHKEDEEVVPLTINRPDQLSYRVRHSYPYVKSGPKTNTFR